MPSGANYHFRQDGDHRFAYDFITLELALSSAGFQDNKTARFRS